MTVKETKQSENDHIPASIRLCIHLDFDSCLEHVDYNIENLSEILTNKRNVHIFDVLNYIIPIITNVCRLVGKPIPQYKDDTFCLQTRLKSCHQGDVKKLESELINIREKNDIYQKLHDARNKTVAHTNSSYQKYGATQNALLEDAIYLIERENCLRNLVKSIKSLIYHVEISVRKKEGKPLNADTFTIRIQGSK